jgi:hypothetical protein
VRSALLGMRAVRVTLVVDVTTTLGTLAATVAGAVVDGAYGAFLFRAVAQTVVAAVWWTVYLRREATATAPVATTESAPC